MPADTKDPTGLQLVDPVLTNLGVAFRPAGFVYDQVVTSLNVQADKGLYPVWDSDDLFRDDVDSRVSDRSETPEIDVGYSTASYNLQPYRLKVTISDEERGQAHNALDFEAMKVRHLRDRMYLRRERRLANLLRSTANGGQLSAGATPAVKWDAGATATIERDIRAARKAIRDASGQFADTIVMDWEVAYAIALDPTIREILKYTDDADKIIVQGDRVLPRVLHGLNVVIATAQVNTARKGAGSQNRSTVWGDSVRIIKRAADDSWDPATVYAIRGLVGTRRPTAGSGEDGASASYCLVDRWMTPDPPVDHIRMWEKVEERVTAPVTGYEIVDVLT